MDYITCLLDKLKSYRAQKAAVEKISHRSVFSNETLRQIAIKRPVNKESLQVIKGLDENRTSKYGDDLLDMIKKTVLKSIRTTIPIPIPIPANKQTVTKKKPTKVVIVNSGTCSLKKAKKTKTCSNTSTTSTTSTTNTTSTTSTTTKTKKKKPEKTLKSVKKVMSPTPVQIQTLPSQPITNVYILQLENNKVYIGKSVDISRRIHEHNNHEGSVFTKKYKPIGVLPRLGNVQGLGDAAERDETLKYMYMRGIENVRGWKYVNIILSKHEIDEAESNIREMFDLCRKCGNQGHFAAHCKQKTDRFGKCI